MQKEIEGRDAWAGRYDPDLTTGTTPFPTLLAMDWVDIGF
jgi:hypothetical protein